MKRGIQTAFVLLTVGVFSAVSISYMAQYAYPIIERNHEAALRQAILAVLPPGAERFETIDENDKIYRGLNGNGETVGYAFAAEGGGYQGIIKMMIGVSPDMQNLTGIIILENLETPGLGAKITSDEFRSQFKNLSLQEPAAYILNKPPEKPNQIQAITGATISSRAVVNILNKTVRQVKVKINQGTP